MIKEIVDIICASIIVAALVFLGTWYFNKPEEPATKTKAERQENFQRSVYRLHDQYLNDNPKLKRLIERGE